MNTEPNAAPVMMTPEQIEVLLDRYQRLSWRSGELWQQCQGKGWPDKEGDEFTTIRDEKLPAAKAAIRAALVSQAAAQPPVQPVQELARANVLVLQEVLGALDDASNGLEWYQERYPEVVDGSDDEANERIAAAIAKLSSLIAAHYVAPPPVVPRIDYSVIHSYAETNNLHYNGLCRMVRDATGVTPSAAQIVLDEDSSIETSESEARPFPGGVKS